MSINDLPEEERKLILLQQKMIFTLAKKTPEEITAMFQTGFFNDFLYGYTVIAMRENGTEASEISDALYSLRRCLDNCDPDTAKQAYKDFINNGF